MTRQSGTRLPSPEHAYEDFHLGRTGDPSKGRDRCDGRGRDRFAR
jgi:hypothetical protein